MRQSESTGFAVNVSNAVRMPSAGPRSLGRFAFTVSSHTTRFGPPAHPQDQLTANVTSCSYGESPNTRRAAGVLCTLAYDVTGRLAAMGRLLDQPPARVFSTWTVGLVWWPVREHAKAVVAVTLLPVAHTP